MWRSSKLLGSAAAVAALAGATPALAAHGDCAFHYGQSVAERLIAPALRERFAQVYAGWSLEDPEITRRDEQVELSFAPPDSAPGKDRLIVMVDPCTDKVMDAHLASPEVARTDSTPKKSKGKASRYGF